ncbi:MAG TPA: zinc dependent phospholipase C family protein [Anaeromyxobacter sp.]|nr:zinc dependent phospholipase C family protein [Anaeromyxobacter sp.]
MPNFHTHWTVALQATSSAPSWIADGRARWLAAAQKYAKSLRRVVEGADDDAEVEALEDAFLEACDTWRDGLRTDPELPGTWDDAACFSAYMLGACGPDVWTVPSKSRHEKIPDFAGKHFDLGHYNRTHRQFQVSVAKLAGAADDLQARVEKSYFLGMATHVGCDLVLHELVNVYAGAYNLLEKRWENEQGYLTKNIWSTHNKVEHYWDTYMRYRYLGDWGPVFGPPGEPAQPAFSPIGLPTREGLVRRVEATKRGAARDALLAALDDELVRFGIEKPIAFPWLAADRVCNRGDLRPFVYSVVIDKLSGAYPRTEVFGLADEEADSFQMLDDRGDTQRGRSERKKLEFFTSSRNMGTDNCSNNYLTYVVCPDFEKLKKYGTAFYEIRAVEAFATRAAKLASAFVKQLSGAYEQPPRSGNADDVSLPDLGRFWNLDCGLGLQVRRVRSDLAKEVITQLDFCHAFEVAAASGPLGFERCADGQGYLDKRKPGEFEYPQQRPAYETYRAEPFAGIRAVAEREDALLERVPLRSPQANAMKPVSLDAFFEKTDAEPAQVCEVPSASVAAANGGGKPPADGETQRKAGEGETQVLCQEVIDRLNLWLRVPIPSLGAAEKLGLFLYADTAVGLDGAAQEPAEPWGSSTGLRTEPVKTKEWLKEVRKKKGLLEFRDVPDDDAAAARSGLRVFSTRVLANLGPKELLEAAKRKPKAGEWNGVVPYDPKRYGRNFVVGTGRSLVLRPTGSGNFDGHKDFGKYANVYPTEQVFLTLYPLVRTSKGVFDAFSRDPVAKDRLAALTRIDATGFVKVVLFYEVGRDGSVQLDECYVDGLKVKVAPPG